jgi:exodeoxyribonuclease III
MKVATYNVNSIRQRLPIVLDWIGEHKPDVMCLQETKVQDADFPAEAIRRAGYHVAYRGMKAYNGVATIPRTPPEKIVYGLHQGSDNEDFRIIQTVFEGIPIINCYVPQGYSIDSEKYSFKLAWFRRLRTYFESALNPNEPAIWLGDLNVAPEPIDVYHPEKRGNDPDFHIDAREAYKNVVAGGWLMFFANFIRKWFSTRTGISIETHSKGISDGVSTTSLRRLPWRNVAMRQRLTWHPGK